MYTCGAVLAPCQPTLCSCMLSFIQPPFIEYPLSVSRNKAGEGGIYNLTALTGYGEADQGFLNAV